MMHKSKNKELLPKPKPNKEQKNDGTSVSQTIAKPNVGCQGLSVSLNDTLYSTLFVYAKNGKIKVLDYKNAKQLKNQMSKDGWIHTETLNACMFLEHLHNNCEEVDVYAEIIELSKKIK